MNAHIYSTLPAVVSAVLTLSACGKSPIGAAGNHGSDTPSATALQRFQPQEDGWQNDPANQPHPNDPNPLRRALGDGPILNGLFGHPTLELYIVCVKQHAGKKLQHDDAAYLPRCTSLQQELLQKARSAGFSNATADDVFDAHLLRLQGG